MEHSRLTIWSLFFLVASCGSVFAQRKPVLPPPVDSLITVGYATGSMKTISGSVEKITETQMNKDQITNPLEAIRGRVPGLTIQRGTNGPAALDAVRLRGTTSLTSGNDPLIIVDGVFGDLSMLRISRVLPSSKMLPKHHSTDRGVPPVSSKSLRRKG